eukprot:c6892_g1_i1.p1 GENE.c6892_g1_i1~~c6892_g1_i1.p1  ORF type:complete len:371 (-),score=91.29 c6892_g1_i1:313-1425(-)
MAPGPVKEVHIPFTCMTLFLLNSWLTLNIVLTLYNKWLFVEAGFPYPLLVTWTHSAVGILLGTATFFTENSAVKIAWKQLLTLSVFFCLSIASGNVALMYIHVSTFQLIKALTPVFQVVVSYFLEHRTYPMSTIMLIPVICVGCCLALYKPPDWNATGYILAFVSAISCALQSSVSAILMHDMNVDVFSAWLWNSIGSFFILLPFVYWFEWEQVQEDWVVTNGSKMTLYLVIGMSLAMAYNICNYSFIRATSSVYTSIAGLVKVVFMILISYYFFPIQLEVFHIIGITIVVIGFAGFSYNMFYNKRVVVRKADETPRDNSSISSGVSSEDVSQPNSGNRDVDGDVESRGGEGERVGLLSGGAGHVPKQPV